MALSLKEIIPHSNSDLFDSLVKCQNYVNLRNWQTEVCNCSNLSSTTLDKIINGLRSHWLTYFEKIYYYSDDAALCADWEVWQLRDKYNRLVDEERWKEQMKLEKDKLSNKIKEIKTVSRLKNHSPSAGARGGNNVIINNYGNNYYQPPVYL